MKNYQIGFRGAAKRDIANLHQYLVHRFDKQTADKASTSLKHSIERLSAMPGLGKDATELSELLAGYRFLPLKRNTVFYRVHDDEQLVEILRIYDNRMDVIAHLLNDREQ
ncbi:type II toxin-antitoxin system RelE/ParE family toxin [Limosilactobacillus walteri]|uniref:Type II toxin-antitoxin system RelE/ParE family toxin n=1 Tax=Limosilactobacillus walteri TaxID=2268022 RepID=A0ABR8P681_9LACO|nr:type II toxin-antitoxin system RelE/ParE family toxin [Limosilactobacillus walteri]MBD5806232.1 type II toxin-antitoxin system RelE/ParE family toxin [Limosilactobacillus walteri]